MDSNAQQQANNTDAGIASTKRQPKQPDDLVIVQIFSKTRDALKNLKKYRRETNSEVLERIVNDALVIKNTNQGA